MNIYQRINSVMKAVSYVQKDARVQNYSAVTHDNVTAVLRPELVKQGIVVEVSQLTGRVLDKWQTKGGANMHRYQGDYEISFVNIETPEDRVTIKVQAHADDTADKAPGKSMSYATKYGMLKTFSLETGENEEGRYGEAYTPEQLEVYHELIDQKKPYDFYLFVATLTQEAATGLYNSFPEGKKSAGKKAASALEASGREIFADTVTKVQSMLANQDPAVLEITSEMSVIEKRFLAAHLTDFETKQLGKMKEAAA